MRFLSIVISFSGFRDIRAAAVGPGYESPFPRSAGTAGESPESDSRMPTPRFDHKTQKDLIEFLRLHGNSKDGQFGLDTIHKPNLEYLLGERIPGGIVSSDLDRDSDINLVFFYPIYKVGHTSVYDIACCPTKVIKYHAYCYHEATNPVDAIVAEAYFMNRLAIEAPGLTSKVYFYSGYESTPPPSKPPNLQKIPNMTCEDGHQPHIRYMIMDKVGPTLFQYMVTRPGGRVDFLEAMQLGKQMIQILQRLHSLNIVHGDAHWGNFAFETDDEGSKLILINFGRSQLSDADDEEPSGKRWELFHQYAALWEMHDCRVSFRNDVYRAVQMTAMSIYGEVYFRLLAQMMEEPDEKAMEHPQLREYYAERAKKFTTMKKTANFWEVKPQLIFNRLLASESTDTRTLIQSRLGKISSLTIAPSEHHSKPDYDGIIAEYDAIIAILSLPAADATVPSLAHTGAPVHKPSAKGALGVV
jgi:hypothetical protein